MIALLASACAQASGEVCQLESDCESGMVCCKNTAAEMSNPTARGICRTNDACEASRIVDAGEVDAQVDSGSDSGVDGGYSAVGSACVVVADAGPPFCFSGLECFRGLCLEPSGGLDGGPPPTDSGVDSGSDAGSDAGEDPDAGQDAGLDGGP